MSHKKIILAVLCILMCFSVALNFSCSKDDDTNSIDSGNITNVYRSSFIEIPENYLIDDRSSIYAYGDKIYAVCYDMSEDMASIKGSVVLEIDKESLDFTERKITVPDLSGQPMYCNTYGVSILSDGSAIHFSQIYNAQKEAMEFCIIRVDSDGNEIFNKSMNEVFPTLADETFILLNKIYTAPDNMTYIVTNKNIFVINPDGTAAFELDTDFYIQNISGGSDGRVIISYYNNEIGKTVFQYIDSKKQSYGNEISLPEDDIFLKSLGNFVLIPNNGSYDIYIKAPSGIYGYNEGDSEAKEVLNYINSDIIPNQVNLIVSLPDGKFAYAARDSLTGKPIISILSRVPDEEVEEKIVITLAYENAGYALPAYIVNFNRESDKYRVMLKDYSFYNTADTPDMGITVLTNEIISGNVPDIIITSINMPIKSFEEKGLFTDLYELMDNDPEFDREDLLSCARVPFENNGKLYRMPTTFFLETIFGKSENLGGKNSWSAAEMMDFIKNLPDGVSFMDSRDTQTSFLYLMLKGNRNDFINYDEKTCNFNSPEFISLLEYAKSLPKEIKSQNADTDYSEFQNDKIMLQFAIINSFEGYLSQSARFGTDDIIPIGRPISGGANGTLIRTQNTFAISADSPSKEGAWEFIKSILESDAKITDNRDNFPVTVKGFDAYAEKQSEKYYFFTNNGEWFSDSVPFDESGYTEMNYFAGDIGEKREGVAMSLTEAHIDKFKEMLDYITISNDLYDTHVTDIIIEEADAYFNGAKSAEETADVIQGRISIYLSENS